MTILELNLHNWRCFSSQKFILPNDSFLILGQNGSGKTSLMSALYSLYTKKSWPKTKFLEHLKNGSQYFGISSQFASWNLTAKIGTNGRLQTKYQKPIQNPLQIFEKETKKNNLNETNFENQIIINNWPKILTYSPEDNLWLSFSRKQKLDYFDDLLKDLFGSNFIKALKNLEKASLAKQRLIKRKTQENLAVDKFLLSSLNKEILKESIEIWKHRWVFYTKIKQNLQDFSTWIQSPLQDWEIIWEIVDFSGQKRKVQDLNEFLKKILKESSQSIFWENLWQKELILQKNLFGAFRDDFYFLSARTLANQSLSRGENRLLVLFIKKLLQDLIQQKYPETKIWWFLDDVFNEFDFKREQIVKQKILTTANRYIITGTKKPSFDIPVFSPFSGDLNNLELPQD